MGLGHTDGQFIKPQAGVFSNSFFSFGKIIHPIGAIDLAGDGLNFLFDRPIQRIEEFELTGLFTGSHDGFGQINGSFATFLPMIANNGIFSAAFLMAALRTSSNSAAYPRGNGLPLLLLECHISWRSECDAADYPTRRAASPGSHGCKRGRVVFRRRPRPTAMHF